MKGVLALLLSLLCTPSGCKASPAPSTQPAFLPRAESRRIVEAVADQVAARNVIASDALRISGVLRRRLQSGAYDAVSTLATLCKLVSADLRAAGGDRHLEVLYRDQPHSQCATSLNGTGRDADEQRQIGRLNNWGFEAVRRLPGNIGYLDLREIHPVDEAGEAAAAAMQFLSHTDALIIDLRANQGGVADMCRLLSGYLLGSQPILLNTIQFRSGGLSQPVWSIPTPDASFRAREVWILTGTETMSMAEAFAYQLPALHRATIVGGRTGGGASLVQWEAIADQVDLRLPVARFIHPLTRTNWEGVGVKPDIEASDEKALETAQLLALKSIRARTTDPTLISAYDALIADMRTHVGDAR